MKAAFHEVLEELLIELVEVSRMPSRLSEDELNLSIGVRVVPSNAEERRTSVYPNTQVATFKFGEQKDVKMALKLRTVNYSYHKTFLQVGTLLLAH